MKNLTLLYTGLFVSSQLFAATPRQQLDPLVVTSTREATPLSSLASNTGLVTEEEIELIRPNHISELVDRVPGVYVHRNNGQENLVSIRSPVLTGAGAAGSFLFMEDGVPLRAAGFSNINGLSEANAEQAGRIEVIRGPGSAFYGSNAMFGLINVLSRSPSKELERVIDFSAGPHGLTGFKTTVSDSSGNQGYRANFNAHHDAGYRAASGYDQQKLTLRHDIHFNSTQVKTVLSAFNLNQETAGFTKSDNDEAYKDTSLSTTNPNPEAYRDWKSFRLLSSWTTKLANGNQFTITPYLRTNEMRFLRHFVPEQSTEENSHKSIGLQTAYAMKLASEHKLVIGTDLEFTRGELEDTQTLPDINKFGKSRPTGKHYDYEVDAYTIAPYLHSEWLVAEKTRLIAGLRFEHTQYDYDNKMLGGNTKEDGSACAIYPSGCLYLRPGDRTDTFNNFSPKLGIVKKLNASNSLYANLSRGFRAPQASELYQLQNKQTEGDIDSEQLDSLEIGTRGLLAGIQYDISVYHMKRKNVFIRDSDGLNVTDGKTKHTGIEVSLSTGLTQTIDIAASFSYARHKYDFDNVASGIKSGNDVDTAPRQQSNIRLGWDFLANSRAELEWIHISKYYTDPSNEHKYDGHDLVNLRVDQAITKQLKLYGRISNLTDTKYAERADYAFGSYRFFPGERRALHVGASLSF
jgi:iron complex outermembrane receptor protein